MIMMKYKCPYLVAENAFDKLWDIRYWLVLECPGVTNLFALDYRDGDNTIVDVVRSQILEDIDGEN